MAVKRPCDHLFTYPAPQLEPRDEDERIVTHGNVSTVEIGERVVIHRHEHANLVCRRSSCQKHKIILAA